jgi:hypothetical protein
MLTMVSAETFVRFRQNLPVPQLVRFGQELHTRTIVQTPIPKGGVPRASGCDRSRQIMDGALG